MNMNNRGTISSNDTVVLSKLFDPESVSAAIVLVDSTLPSDPHIQNIEYLQALKNEELEIIRRVEAGSNAASTSEERKITLESAYFCLTALISSHPDYASLYNNRAQLLRLQHGNDVLVKSSARNGKALEHHSRTAVSVLCDLDIAVNLLTPPNPHAAISPAQCRTLAQAHTQRATLFHVAAKKIASEGTDDRIWVARKSLGETVQGWTRQDLEEAASKDFFMGGWYGNELGKALAIHTNPTAKLCGQVVQDAMRRTFSPDKMELA